MIATPMVRRDRKGQGLERAGRELESYQRSAYSISGGREQRWPEWDCGESSIAVRPRLGESGQRAGRGDPDMMRADLSAAKMGAG
jgi:hypothetical protein